MELYQLHDKGNLVDYLVLQSAITKSIADGFATLAPLRSNSEATVQQHGTTILCEAWNAVKLTLELL